MIEKQIENYAIQEKLGEGGMGTVYRALETHLDRLVAIKVLKTDVAQDPSLVERFRSEARAQANLNHTNIATLYAFLVHQGSPVMVMEYVDGESFQQMVNRRGPIPAHEAIPLFRQALLGIGAAHRMGIIHRDIKPSNLMLSRSGIVKVMDFGLAKVASTARGLTRTGTQMGTIFYMSPEQVKGERVDIRSDIYSLGVTLYELLTANVPFSSDSEFQVLSDHVNTPPPPPSKFHPYLSKGLENIILKALEKNPDNRFQTVDEFGAALEQPEAWETSSPPSASSLKDTVLTGAGLTAAALSVPSPMQASPPPPAPEQFGAQVSQQAVPPVPNAVPPVTQAKVTSGKLIAAAVVVFCLVGGGAYLYSHSRNASLPHPIATSPNGSGSSAPADSRADDQMHPILQDATGVIPSSPLVSASGVAPNTAGSQPVAERAKSGSRASRSIASSKPPSQVDNSQPKNTAAPDQTPATVANTAPPPKPASSPAELDEARQRFIRLRSKALALKSNLVELRQRLASQQMSVSSDAIEAEGNMDSYMAEADRALQAGDAPAAQTNLDRAEHEAKKISALFGR